MLYDHFITVLHSPEKVKFFIQLLNSVFYQIFGSVLLAFFIIFIILFGYQALKTVKRNWSNRQLTPRESKTILKTLYEKHKNLTQSIRHLGIWFLLHFFTWKLVDLSFSLLASYQGQVALWARIEDPAFYALNSMMGNWSLYTMLIFSFAPFFIAYCFGNKFVRNIGILIYIAGILFVFFGFFVNLVLYR